MAMNKFKYSGLANSKSIGMELEEETDVPQLTTVTTKKNKPNRRVHTIKLKPGRGPARNNQTIEAAVSKYYYRRDLLKEALAKHTKISKAAARKAAGVKPKLKERRGRN